MVRFQPHVKEINKMKRLGTSLNCRIALKHECKLFIQNVGSPKHKLKLFISNDDALKHELKPHVKKILNYIMTCSFEKLGYVGNLVLSPGSATTSKKIIWFSKLNFKAHKFSKLDLFDALKCWVNLFTLLML